MNKKTELQLIKETNWANIVNIKQHHTKKELKKLNCKLEKQMNEELKNTTEWLQSEGFIINHTSDNDTKVCLQKDGIQIDITAINEFNEQSEPTKEYLKAMGEDEVFSLFHSIYWRIKQERPKDNELIILDSEIGKAIKDLFKTYEVTK